MIFSREHMEATLRQAQDLLKQGRANGARFLFQAANEEIKVNAHRLLQSGQARDNQEAHRMACRMYGPAIAENLQTQLRSMGARDVTVTCP